MDKRRGNQDEMIQFILQGLAEGKDREELADELGYKNYRSLHSFMQRRGYDWDRRRKTYIQNGTKTTNTDQEPLSGSVSRVVQLMDKYDADAKKVASELQFASYTEMARFMKSRGYIWSNERRNYIPTEESGREPETIPEDAGADMASRENLETSGTGGISSGLESYEGLLQFLDNNKDRLKQLLEEDSSNGQIPRLSIPGKPTSKTVYISSGLDRLTRDFSQEKKMSQKEIFEVALVQFFEKYGYAQEVEMLKNA